MMMDDDKKKNKVSLGTVGGRARTGGQRRTKNVHFKDTLK